MKKLGLLAPRIEYILMLAIFWGTVASGPRILNFDGDLPRHLLVGNEILQTQHVATSDIFSFRTVGYPSIPHEWLSQVLFAALYNWLGLDGVVVMTALILTLTWMLVYRRALRKSNSFFAALLVTVLGVGATQIHVLPRPHIFTYVLVSLWITLIESIRVDHRRFVGILPLAMLIWVNVHGMFVLGIIILGIYVLGGFLDHPSLSWFKDQKTKLLLIGAGLSLLATLLSPSGARIWEAIASLGRNAYLTSRIPEYQSPDFHVPETWPFLILVFIAAFGFGRSEKKTTWTDILLFASFAGLALYTSRMIPLFAIVVAPVTAEAILNWAQSEFPRHRLFAIQENISRINSQANGFIWFPVVILIAVVILRSGQAVDPAGRRNVFDPGFFPVLAADWLEAHPQAGHMFNAFDWGGYLLFRLWPDQQIFMDGHTHIYGEALTREYEQVITLQDGWQEIFERYNITWVIVPPGWILVQELTAQGWEITYEDQTAVIVVKK